MLVWRIVTILSQALSTPLYYLHSNQLIGMNKDTDYTSVGGQTKVMVPSTNRLQQPEQSLL